MVEEGHVCSGGDESMDATERINVPSSAVLGKQRGTRHRGGPSVMRETVMYTGIYLFQAPQSTPRIAVL